MAGEIGRTETQRVREPAVRPFSERPYHPPPHGPQAIHSDATADSGAECRWWWRGDRILKRTATRARVDPHLATRYRLRHYLGLTSAMAGVATTALMRAMGHRSAVVTARYSGFADAERRWAFARADITRGIALPGTHRQH